MSARLTLWLEGWERLPVEVDPALRDALLRRHDRWEEVLALLGELVPEGRRLIAAVAWPDQGPPVSLQVAWP